jgi:hypothetical protein
VTQTGTSIHGLANLHSLYTLRATDPLQQKHFQRRNNDCIIQKQEVKRTPEECASSATSNCVACQLFPLSASLNHAWNPVTGINLQTRPQNTPFPAAGSITTGKHSYEKSGMVQSLFNEFLSTGEVIWGRMWWGNYYVRLTENNRRRNWYCTTVRSSEVTWH